MIDDKTNEEILREVFQEHFPNKIAMIRAYRDRTGCKLQESMHTVDRYIEEYYKNDHNLS